MGWRGTVRSLGAMARQAERESMRRARANAQHMAMLEKEEAKEKAAQSVHEFDAYVERLVRLHHMCSDLTNWKDRATREAPREPQPGQVHELAAKRRLECYKATFGARLLRRVEKEKKSLADAVAAGKELDEKEYADCLAQFPQDVADHQDEVAFAGRVLCNNPEAMLEAIKLFEPLASIGLLGEHMHVSVAGPKALAIELTAHGTDLIPKDRPKLLASGRVSVKAMPKGEYNRLYQDHICSAGLRVVRELLALLPVDEIFVTVLDNLVDPSTGHLTKTPILSFRAPRSTMDRLNFQGLDPSDSMKNFLYAMKFTAKDGMGRVEKIVADMDTSSTGT